MDAAPKLSLSANLKIQDSNLSFGELQSTPGPNGWFCSRYPDQFHQFGSPFLELHENGQIIPISINIDFFAGVLGGRKDLHHHVIYYAPELAWYFKNVDGVFKSTTAEKLANLYRALILKCAQDQLPIVNQLNLFQEFRSDRVAKAVVNRAKSVLEANESFFSPTSPYSRIKGPELFERVARIFVDDLLTKEAGHILKLQDAHHFFLSLLKERNLPPINRSEFREVVVPLIKHQFDVCLRNDLPVEGLSGVRGWKGVKLIQTAPGNN